MKWISVEDKLPQNDGQYCVVSNGVTQVAAIWYEEFFYPDETMSNPTHWKPVKLKFQLSWRKNEKRRR